MRDFLFIFVITCLFLRVKSDCLPTIPLVLNDIHDGDQKEIKSITWDTFVVHPLPNRSDWEIQGKFDINCVSIIDFNVSGKPNPPPVPLKMAMWVMQCVAAPGYVRLGFEFTDPSETLAPRTQPINMWLSVSLSGPSSEKMLDFSHSTRKKKDRLQSQTCLYTPRGQPEIFNDLKVSDKKGVIVDGNQMTIEPYDNAEKWSIESVFKDYPSCYAPVNFNVPGYPDPPSAPEMATVWGMASIDGKDKDSLIYSQANPVGSPLNVWLPGNEDA